MGPDRFIADPPADPQRGIRWPRSPLCVNENADIHDVFERGPYQTWGREDLLNLAIVQTMLHRGEAFELPASAMPGGAAAVAMLRY